MTKNFSLGIHLAPPLTVPETIDNIRKIEAAGFSFATLGGGHLSKPGIDPVQLAAFIGQSTFRLGLIPEIPITYVEPFHTATQLISADYATKGRTGWLLSTENSAAAAAQFGQTELGTAELETETAEVVSVIRALLDSWEDDAVIRDLPTGRYIDRNKLHYVDFVGSSFTVKGPAITPRPPQGQVPILGTLDSKHADVDIVLAPEDQLTNIKDKKVFADLSIALDSRGTRANAPADFVGSPAELVAKISELSTLVDGIRLRPATPETDLDELIYVVLPKLISTGVLVPPAYGATLRQTFGLPVAENIFTSSRT